MSLRFNCLLREGNARLDLLLLQLSMPPCLCESLHYGRILTGSWFCVLCCLWKFRRAKANFCSVYVSITSKKRQKKKNQCLSFLEAAVKLPCRRFKAMKDTPPCTLCNQNHRTLPWTTPVLMCSDPEHRHSWTCETQQTSCSSRHTMLPLAMT